MRRPGFTLQIPANTEQRRENPAGLGGWELHECVCRLRGSRDDEGHADVFGECLSVLEPVREDPQGQRLHLRQSLFPGGGVHETARKGYDLCDPAPVFLPVEFHVQRHGWRIARPGTPAPNSLWKPRLRKLPPTRPPAPKASSSPDAPPRPERLRPRLPLRPRDPRAFGGDGERPPRGPLHDRPSSREPPRSLPRPLRHRQGRLLHGRGVPGDCRKARDEGPCARISSPGSGSGSSTTPS